MIIWYKCRSDLFLYAFKYTYAFCWRGHQISGSLKAKIIVVVVLLALTAALVGTCIAYRNRACEHTSLEHIEAVEPTCTESGNIEHWACKRCGATFKDESGAEEIGRVVRTALGHDLTRHSAVEPTCTEAGNA